MNPQMLRRTLAGLTISTAFALAVACSSPASLLSPTGPTAAVSASSAASGQTVGTDFSINPCDPATDPECPPPPPPPEGQGCSPGYWKNHAGPFAAACQAAADLRDDRFPTCASLYTAITCKGSNESCGRQAAASLLNEVSGCVED